MSFRDVKIILWYGTIIAIEVCRSLWKSVLKKKQLSAEFFLKRYTKFELSNRSYFYIKFGGDFSGKHAMFLLKTEKLLLINIETSVFLRSNRDSWTAGDVQKLI